MTSFSQQIAAFNRKAQLRIQAASQDAVQNTLAEASAPRPKGRMRVDTGFNRASLQASLSGMPSGPTTNEGDVNYGDAETEGLPAKQVAGEPVGVTLLRWDPNTGEPFHAGWTSSYARHREARDGFLRGAVENWPVHVEKAAKTAQRRIR